jgi:hypothetical protein
VHAGDETIVLDAVMVGREPIEVALQNVTLKIGEVLLAGLVGDAELLFHAGDRDRADSPSRHRPV